MTAHPTGSDAMTGAAVPSGRCPFHAPRQPGQAPTYDRRPPAAGDLAAPRLAAGAVCAGDLEPADAPPRGGRVGRRSVLRAGGVGAAVLAAGALDVAMPVRREAEAAVRRQAPLPDIQYAIGSHLGPPVLIEEPGAPAGGTYFGFGPVYTLFLTAQLTRRPRKADQKVLAAALATIERRYPFSASGVFTHIAYGIPYFSKLPGGMTGNLVARRMPRLIEDTSRFVLEEAVPGPTDQHHTNPAISKPRFNVPVRIEDNDVLITLRSDSTAILYEIQNWLWGSGLLASAAVASPPFRGLFTWTTSRLMFGGRGLPRQIADANHLPYARYVHPGSPMWMGFADMVADAFAPPQQVAFQGSPAARLTTQGPRGYFLNSSIQVLNHVILDLTEWYLTNGTEITPNNADVSYLERAQYMYRPHDPPSFGYADQFTDGGGPTFLPNRFQGTDDARNGCLFGSFQQGFDPTHPGVNSQHKILGHISTLQRTSRATDGTPLHIRVDGPGFDAMDVPDGSNQPKLHFSALVPTSDLFRRMRISQASLDLANEFAVEAGDQGLEHRITATRRQNFLMPRRSHRAFPLLELT